VPTAARRRVSGCRTILLQRQHRRHPGAAGEVVVTMGADGQHPPSTIPGFVERWRGGTEVVHAVRSAPSRPRLAQPPGGRAGLPPAEQRRPLPRAARSGEAVGDPVAGARRAEYEILAGPMLARLPAVRPPSLEPMSRVLAAAAGPPPTPVRD